MSDIYEQKTKKYKYKYLKLKQELLGGAAAGAARSDMSLCQLLNLNKITKSINIDQYENHFYNIYRKIGEEIDINILKKHIKTIYNLQNNSDLIKRKNIHMLLGQKKESKC
jgi:hypothetical protein